MIRHIKEQPTKNSQEEDHKEGVGYFAFLSSYVFSTDHKVIAKQYLFTGIFWALIGSFVSIIMRIQLGFPGVDLSWLEPVLGNRITGGRIDPEFYLSMVTMHGTIMIFFVLTGAFIGTLGNLLIPLQIGARDMASGFINMLSYWTFFLSGIVLLFSFFLESGAASSGWTAYPPLSVLQEASMGSGAGMTFWIVSMVLFIISTAMTAINFITTIINMRTVGLSFRRLPLTIWAFLFTAILSLLSFPVLFAAMLLLFFDKALGTSFYLSDIFIAGVPLANSGGTPILYQHLFWFLGHPEVYIAIFPAFGIVSDVVSTHARKPIFGYPAMVAAIFAIMILSFIVWAHHMFVSGMDPFLGSVFSLTSFIIAVPSAIKVFNWITTLWRGNIHLAPSMLFAIAFVSFFITGGLTGLFLANSAIDIELHDTYFVVAHFHLVMGSAAFFGFLCGVYHWFPKMFGRMMNTTLSYLHFWITFTGIYLIFFPMHFLGLTGLPRRYYSFTYFETFNVYPDLNSFISIAAFITFLAQFIFVYNFFRSLAVGKKAPANPWRANTLEWTTRITPVEGNWEGPLPHVYRWPYDYSVPGAKEDFIPQNIPEQGASAKPFKEMKSGIKIYALTLLVLIILIPDESRGSYQQDSSHAFQRGRSLFQTNCASCHGVHKARTGPMLASITRKKSKEWLHGFIRNSQEVIVSGDAYAAYLFQSYNQQVMPAFKEMPDSLIADILYYIEKESTRPVDDLSDEGLRKSLTPSVLRGKEIFSRQCASCHSIAQEDYGPALGSISKRLPERWLVAFIRNSQEVIERGDPYAVNMFNEFDQKVMVPMEFLTRSDIRSILDYIEYASSSIHPVAGVNGWPMAGRQYERRTNIVPPRQAEEESSFKIPFLVLTIMAAFIHGYLIVRLFLYLNKGEPGRI